MSSRPLSQIVLWGLRILALARKRGADAPCPLDGPWLRLLGLTRRHDRGIEDEEVSKAVHKSAKRAEARARGEGVDRGALLFENVAMLGARLGLSTVERDLLAFGVAAHTDDLLLGAFEQLGREASARAFGLLAAVLGSDEALVRKALGQGGVLSATALVRVGRCTRYHHHEPLRVDWGLSELLQREHDGPAEMLASFFRPSKPARLHRSDYEHVATDVDIIIDLLRAAHASSARGVNVLVYGPPGTGKTELARMAAAEVGAELFEVSAEDEDGQPVSRVGRLAGYSLTQRLLAGGDHRIVLFDEIEDVFARRSATEGGEAGLDKAWTNRLLEESLVPTLWLANGIEAVDRAFLRRFDYALELRVPPARVRQRLLGQYAADLPVRAAWIESTASDDRLTPAHIERAVRVARLVGATSAAQCETTLARVLDHSLTLGGRARPAALATSAIGFELGLLRASVDLEQVTAGLARSRAGSLCLFGPPGTGKTAFAHHLARVVGAPLHVRRASDLLSPYVGETEHNLAAMFRCADDERAILLLDEADSFFRSRARASHSWEVTQVNELLVQMETFHGVFVCATNLMDELDDAALRRFSLKIRFDPPTRDQRWRLFVAVLHEAQARFDESELTALRARLDRVDTLTPGDFATVARRTRLLGAHTTASQLCSALCDEARTKARGARDIGFAARA